MALIIALVLIAAEPSLSAATAAVIMECAHVLPAAATEFFITPMAVAKAAQFANGADKFTAPNAAAKEMFPAPTRINP